MSPKTIMIDDITLSLNGIRINTDKNIRRLIREERQVIIERRLSYLHSITPTPYKSLPAPPPSPINPRKSPGLSPNISPYMGHRAISKGTPKRLTMRRCSVCIPPFTL